LKLGKAEADGPSTATLRLSRESTVECFVITDPYPGDGLALKNADGAIVPRDACGPIERVVE
jgi:hypothetical protein